MKVMKVGKIEIITGCMFSGKSEELIRRLKREQIAKHEIQIFNPVPQIVTNSGEKFHVGTILNSSKDILSKISDTVQVVGIDEAQFYDMGIIETVKDIATRGIRVIIAGLDMDFRGEVFGPMGNLMAIADEVTKLHAICTVCGEEATMTQRIINGKAAHSSDPVVLIGASERYEARCKLHHEVIK